MTDFDKDRLAADTELLGHFNREVIDEFRTNSGEVGSLPGGRLLLLHTTGAKSGEPRLSPLAYLVVDGRTLIVGSYLGAAKDPAWVRNLRADPRARVEVGTDSYDVTARELSSADRAEHWPEIVGLAPVLGEYQAQTDRAIPVFELNRV